ncbi:putative mitochondrial protein [Vitis vinifera]|uniref:Putative mitochondrial protein n=1 Tax=Vitis vinifera TaxID=29760 RepID=A0A438FTG4_VITVI|nr:putative mitochondrial protein [Vitis vinifera]
MVHQGIVLGHIISKQGIEVDKAKVELIVMLPLPTTIKGVRQFLGHARFYRRFIKDFSKLARPLCELLVKDAKFVWDDQCQRSFEELKLFLMTPPIVRASNWQLPFEVMCDDSDFVIRDAKVRLIRWILLLQEFNLQIKDKKGVENVVANHLSRLAIAHNSQSLPIHDDFPEESLMLMEVAPWSCDTCQRLGKLTRMNMMPLNPILIIDLFDVRAIDFMGPFPMSFGYSYILVGVDYVSKWVEAIPCKSKDHRVVLKFLKDNIFSRIGVPKTIISDGGTHFCNKPFETLLAKDGVKHKVATPY